MTDSKDKTAEERIVEVEAQIAAERAEQFRLLKEAHELIKALVAQRYEMRVAELEAARAAEFQRQVLALAPAIVNTITGAEIFPKPVADASLFDTMFETTSPEKLEAFLGHMARITPNGEELSVLIRQRYNRFQEKRAALRAEEKRLMEESRADYDAGEKDAAGAPPFDAIPPGEMNVELWEALKALLLDVPKREAEVRQDERARIAAWLRRMVGYRASLVMSPIDIAEAIERGDHTKEPHEGK